MNILEKCPKEVNCMGKIKLGIVDDNKDFCEALQDFFSCQQDMEVVFSAEDGIQAMEEIGKNDVDVLILDLIMPHLDGIGVLEALNLSLIHI